MKAETKFDFVCVLILEKPFENFEESRAIRHCDFFTVKNLARCIMSLVKGKMETNMNFAIFIEKRNVSSFSKLSADLQS